MTDALADVALLRAAGYYLAGYDDPDEAEQAHYVHVLPLPPQPPGTLTTNATDTEWVSVAGTTTPPHPFAARPGHMPPVGETVDDLVAELETARGLLKALAGNNPATRISHVAPAWECTFCFHERVWHAVNVLDIANHAPDCPWRKAKEYTQALEAKRE
jgi:hypothetical protein